MKKAWNRVLAMLLTALFILSPASNAASVLAATPEEGQKGAETSELQMTDLDPATLHVKKLGETDEEPLTPADAEDLNALVRVSIFLTEPGAVDAGYSTESIGTNAGARSYRSRIESQQKAMTSRIENALGYSINVKWNLTLLTNAISCYVKVKDIAAIERMDGVKCVERERQYEAQTGDSSADPNTSNTSSGMVGATEAWKAGYSGAGSRIAIIDTGIDTTHQSFAADPFEKHINELGKSSELMTKSEVQNLASQLNSKTGNYVSSKIPYGYNYVDGGTTINHLNDTQGEHGSHVAGIASANYYIKSGSSYVKAAESVHAVGMAPDAQLLIMKVFGAGNGASDSDYMAAIEDAILLGCDSVNLSLGSADQGFTYAGQYQEIMNKLASNENLNMVVTISAGNSYALNDFMENDIYIEDVYLHTGGSPGTFLNSLGVAAAENIGATGAPLTINGNNIFYDDASESPVAFTSIAGTYSYVYINATGSASDYQTVNSAVSLSGKIVIINRGTNSFAEKATNAWTYNPKGIIIANNVSGSLGATVEGYEGDAPVATISLESAELIKSLSTSASTNGITYYTGSITVTNTTQTGTTTTRDKAEITDFSSWGVPGSLVMKPEITAPGGNIYSVFGTNKTSSGTTAGGSDQYEMMSGTSMAAPHMAGLAAIVSQYLRENDLSKKNEALTANYSNRAINQSLLMSTATPMKEGSKYYPILRQGAGLAEVSKAIKASSVIMMDDAGLATSTGASDDGKVKVEFGDDPFKEGRYTYSFTIYNISDNDLTFDLRTDLFTQDRRTEGEDVYISQSTADLNASVSYEWEAISGPAPSHDVNRDNQTDNNDVLAILDYLTGEKAASDVDLTVADMDGDGKVTTKDAQLLIDWEGEEGPVAAGVVPAGQKRQVTVTILLNEGQKNELDADYPCGAYLEGFTYVTCNTSDAEGNSYAHEHSIPLLGFYGSWTDSSMFDNTSYTDVVYGIERVPYGNTTNTNYLTVQYNGTNTKFTGNPYMLEEKFPSDRLAVNSNSKFGNIVYTLFRSAGTTGFAVSKLDEIDGDVTEVLSASVTGTEVTGIYYYVNQSTWMNLGSKSYSINKNAASYGLKQGDKFRIGYYAIPEYYAMQYNKNDMTAADAGMLGSVGFRDVLSDNSLGKGAFVGYDFVVDDTAPQILSSSLNGNNLTISASDNENLAYVAVMSLDGDTVYYDAAPADSEFSSTINISSAIANANGYVAVFAGDYAGNEAAVAVQVNENVTYEKAFYVLTNTLTAGEDYLIVNTSASGKGYALKYTPPTSGNEATVGTYEVTIVTGTASTQNQPFIESADLDANAVWTVGTGSTSGTYTFGNNGWYLRRSSSNNLTITKDTSRRDWTWNGTNNRLSINSRYLRYYNNTYSINTATNSVYLYKKTTIAETADPYTVSAVSVTPESLDLYKNETADLTAKVLPLTVENRSVTWSSSNNSIATVDENGHVTAVSAGTATITATSQADPSISTAATVKVTSVDKTLNGIVWDEEGGVYFSSFNASSLPTWTKLHNDAKSLELYSAYMQSTSNLYAFTLDTSSAETELYSVNRSSYALTDVAPSFYFALGVAKGITSSTYSGYADYVYSIQNYMACGNISSKTESLGDGSSFTGIGIPYGLEDLSETLGDSWIAGVAARSIGSTSSSYYILDENGIIWQTTLSYNSTNGFVFSTPTKVIETGISTSFLYQSLYYDGTYIYWSHTADDLAELIIINPSTGAVYHAGNFGENVWPVGGLYVNGSVAPASTGDETMGEGELPVNLKPVATREQLMTEEVMERFAAEVERFNQKATIEEAVPAGGLNSISTAARAPKKEVYRDAEPVKEDETTNSSYEYVAAAPVANGLVELDYDPEKLTYFSTESELAFTSVHVDAVAGKITFAYANVEPVPKEEVIAEFVFEETCESVEITVTTMEAGDTLTPAQPETPEIPGEGHEYGDPEWTWAEDYSSATAEFVCKHDKSHVEKITTDDISTEEKDGYIIYIATVEFEGKSYTDQESVKLPVAADGYYLVGSAIGWDQVDETYHFVENPQVPGEYYLHTNLSVGDQIKVAGTANGQIIEWFPGEGHNAYGTTANYVVDEAHSGPVTIYFRPDGNSDSGWQPFGGYFFIEQDHEVDVQIAEGQGDAYVVLNGNHETSFTAPRLMTVEVITEPAQEYVLAKIELWRKNGESEDFEARLEGTSFTMGDHDLIVKVYFEFSGHTLTKTEANPATCTKPGNTAYWTCETCGKYFGDAEGTTEIKENSWVIAALGHDWDEGKVTTEPTCTEKGVKTFTCSRCGETRTEDIDALGHVLSKTNAKDPTCTEAGNSEYWTCSRCGHFFGDAEGKTEIEENSWVIAALGHDWEFKGFTWTGSDEAGYTAAVANYTCKNDGSHKETVAAEVTSKSSDATCTEPGSVTYTATVTAEKSLDKTEHIDTKTVSDVALGHDWETPVFNWGEEYIWDKADWDSVTSDDVIAITMLVDGQYYILTSADGTNKPVATAVILEADGESFKSTEIDKTGWVKEATNGGDKLKANNGQNVYLRTDANTKGLGVGTISSDHYYIVNLNDDGKYLTLSNDAGTARVLGVFGKADWRTYTEVHANIVGETLQIWKLRINPAVTATRTCKRDSSHTETVICTVDVTTKEATCTKEGEIVKTATATFSDGDPVTDEKKETIPALGHDWDEGKVTTEPTCTEKGVKTFTCSRCGETRTEDIDALGHELTKTDAKDPTCTEAGNSEYWTCSRCRHFFGDAEGKTEIEENSWVIAALGHDWKFTEFTWTGSDEAGYTAAVANYVCNRDAEHTETVNAEFKAESSDAGCTTPGTVVYTVSVSSEASLDKQEHSETKTVTGAALGHDLKKTEATPATCTTNGNSEYWTCSRCGLYFSDAEGTKQIEKDSWIIYAFGHEYGEPTYTWKEDLSEATAAMVCKHDSSHVVNETVKTTSKVTKEATCEEKGETTYTAAFANKAFDAQTKTVANIPALGHDWGEAEFTWNGFEATATKTCKRDASHKQTATVTVTSQVTKEATATEDGVRTYTATATFADGTTASDTKTEVIPATGETSDAWTWTRLAGNNRYSTMATITQEAYAAAEEGTMTTLIVATGASFPDALAGASLAGVYGCPIILTAKDKLSAQAKSEIKRLASKQGCKVLILGGESAVQKEVETAIKAIGKYLTTERVAGSTRIATAIAVYNKGLSEINGFENAETVIITTGFNYADALSISPYAYASKTPILLTKKDGTLDKAVKNTIANAGFKKAIILGGNAAVAAETESYLKKQGMTVLRLEGSNRYKTSAQIIRWSLGLNEKAAVQPSPRLSYEGMGIATGQNFADALASVSLLGKTKSVLLLVNENPNNATTLANINEFVKPYAREMGKGYIFGGEKAVPAEIEERLNQAVREGYQAPASVAQIVWTEGNKTLTFLYSPTVYQKGDTLNGQTVTQVWSGDQVTAEGNAVSEWKQTGFAKMVFDKSFLNARPTSIADWFAGVSDGAIVGLKYLNTSHVTNMDCAFRASSVKKLDLSTFDTSNVISMIGMFDGCDKLESLDLSAFDTSKVQYMERMFSLCYALKTLDLSGFDASSLKSTGMMFLECYSLTTLDLSGFDHAKLTDAFRMFDGCSSLRTIYCGSKNAAWTVTPEADDPNGNVGLFYGDSELVGIFGSKQVKFNGDESADRCKSANLGGYFTPKE